MPVEKRMPALPEKIYSEQHSCDFRVEGEFGPGTRWYCDVCRKNWVYEPTKRVAGKIATWPFGALIRLTFHFGTLGIFRFSGNAGVDGWRSRVDLFVSALLNWLIILPIFAVAVADALN